LNLIEKLLKEYKETTKLKIADIEAKIKVLESEKLTLATMVNQTTKELQTICTHEKTHRVNGPYYEGGYLDKSEQHYTINCINCGKVLESSCIRGTYA